MERIGQYMKKMNREFIRETWQLTRAYWYSEEKWSARFLLGTIVGLNLGQVYVLVLLNQWNNTFYNALQNYDTNGFWSGIKEFSILAAAHIIVAVYQIYLRQMLQIRWRRWMTACYVDKWLEKRTYYRMQLLDHNTDNPDQRISEDLNLFTAATLNLSLGFLKSVVTLGSFIFILWTLSGNFVLLLGQYKVNIPGYMVWVSILYAGIGTWLTVKIGRPLINLNYNQQRYEADFRFSMVRLRENSESIAFYGGEKQERSAFMQRFHKAFENFWELMRRQKQLTWFTSGYGQIAIIFPFLVASPRYLANEIQLGGLMQIATAFGRVQDALSFFVDSYTDIAAWRAVVDRLLGFVGNMEQVSTDKKEIENIQLSYRNEPVLTVSDLHIQLPKGEKLLNQLNVKISAGDSVLVVGPSGCGKSTLMRSLAGLWPFGQGTISLPKGQRTLFLPQKAYLPLGTLKDILLYPYANGNVSDEEIKKVMVLCKLEVFLEHLHVTEDWSHVLSLGEQQRIAFARALLQKPLWLFLDEATSALDEPAEKALYKILKEQLPDTTIISVGHRNTLTSYHNKKLTLDGLGNWNLLTI